MPQQTLILEQKKICNVCNKESATPGFEVLGRTRICSSCLEELILWFAEYKSFKKATTSSYI